MTLSNRVRAFVAVFFIFGLFGSAVLHTACGVPAVKHVENLAESGEYSAQLAVCREDAKKLEAGTQKDAYHKCACDVDKKHNIVTPGC